MKWIVLSMIFAISAISAGTVRLLNDSPYVLKAVVRGADGSFLAEMEIKPSDSSRWTDTYGQVGSFGRGNITGQELTGSTTPYTVHWYCMDGGDYSICTDVPPGATVTAQTCAGSRSCKPASKDKNTPSSQPEERPQTFGPPNSGAYGPPGSR